MMAKFYKRPIRLMTTLFIKAGLVFAFSTMFAVGMPLTIMSYLLKQVADLMAIASDFMADVAEMILEVYAEPIKYDTHR